MIFRIISLAVIIRLVLNLSLSYSQGIDGDPLSRVRDLINSDEIILINSQTLGSDPTHQTMRGRIIDYDYNQSNLDLRLVPKSIQNDSIVTDSKRMDVASGNFQGSRFKHMIAAWTGTGNSIRISVPQIESGSLTWPSANRLTIPNAVLYVTTGQRKSKVRIVTGNFYGDHKDEAVVGYVAKDSSIKIKLINVSTGLVPAQGDSISNEKVIFFPPAMDVFDITAGDFDGDGYDEIGLVFVKRQGLSNWSMSVRIYKLNSSGQFVSKGTRDIMNQPLFNVTEIQISAAAKDFNYNAADEIVAGYVLVNNVQNGPEAFIDILEVKDTLSNIITMPSRRLIMNGNSNADIYPFEVCPGDFNGDGNNEIALSRFGTLYIVSVDNSLIPVLRISGGSIPGWTMNNESFSERVLATGDLDYNRKSEIIAVGQQYSEENNNQEFYLYAYEIDSAMTSFILKGRKTSFENISLGNNTNNIRHFAVGVGDFNGDRARLGPPVHYNKRLVKQSLVILNTPPVHYDIFEPQSNPHDISGCFPSLNCGFTSQYVQSQIVDTTIEFKVHSDWGIDASLSSQASYGVFVKAKIKATYAEGFDNVSGSGTTLRVTEGRVANGDDFTYSIVQDYDFYEYPVYDSNDVIIGNMLTIIPGPTTKLWAESKDDFFNGNLIRSGHETGNILSYRDSAVAEDTSEIIHQFNPQTVGSSGNSFIELERQTFLNNQVSTEKTIGVEVSASVGFGDENNGFEIGVTGRYSQSEISTVTTKISNSMLLRADFGRLNSPYNIPENTYYITPYAYWAKNGALVLDYKVNISSNPNSFWNINYGNKSDLAFSLPWRLDPEKGFALPENDSAYRFRSRDIQISKEDPIAGDTIMIRAKVGNYALQNITAPVTVRFYRGNPYEGGTQIGQSVISGGINARKYKFATISWVVPPAVPRGTRIYAFADPDNAVNNEVHENNNRGWTTLSEFSLPVSVNNIQSTVIPEKIELYQNYPNPFNPSTTIKFSIPVTLNTTLKIYNILGKEVKTLVSEKLSPGSYEVNWNASEISSGVYFYSLNAGGLVETRKLMLVK